MITIPYPGSPKANKIELTQVSPQYRAQVIRVLASIVLFIAGYLFIFAIALVAFAAALLAASAILGAIRHWLGLVLILGILLTASMFFFFIVKFLFQIKKDTDESRIEISEKDQPRLYEFIKRVCEETQADFPKKIVISPYVNASVYYNSSFLSMFLPLRKNLEIGAGLLNCVNLTEFKAILAHEFGHFSQSSTRLGSYTYSFNKMVYNLLYENEGWINTLNSVMSIHSMLSFFGRLTVWLVKGVISFFMGVYKIMHRSYLALSREMEFHADSVAVSVSGSKPIISALYRLEFAQEAYNYTVQGITSFSSEKSPGVKNFFSLHRRNILVMAEQNKLTLEHGLPVIEGASATQNKAANRLQYKDVWSSHPSIAEREQNAMKTELDSEMIFESPWILFNEPEQLQMALSLKIPELQNTIREKEIVENDRILAHFKTKEQEAVLNPVYGDYYRYASNTKSLPFEDKKESLQQLEKEPVEELFKEEVIRNLRQYHSDLVDTETMRLISGGHLQVKRFSFDGKPYTRYYSNEIYNQLKADTENQEKQLTDYNRKISSWFYARALKDHAALANEYLHALKFSNRLWEDKTAIHGLLQELVNFYNEHIRKYNSPEDILSQSKKIKEIYTAFKKLQLEHPGIEVPKRLISPGFFENGYSAAVFAPEVRDPGPEEGLEGMNPLYEDLTAVLEKQPPLELKTDRLVLALQDEILLRLAQK